MPSTNNGISKKVKINKGKMPLSPQNTSPLSKSPQFNRLGGSFGGVSLQKSWSPLLRGIGVSGGRPSGQKSMTPPTRMRGFGGHISPQVTESPPSGTPLVYPPGQSSPTKLRPPFSQRANSDGAATSRVFRKIRLDPRGDDSSSSRSASFEMQKNVLNETFDQIYVQMAQVDRLLDKVASKFKPEDLARLEAGASEDDDDDNEEDADTEEEIDDDEGTEVYTTMGMVVYSGSATDEGHFYAMEPEETFAHIYGEYAAMLDTTAHKIKLLHDGRLVSPHDTTQSAAIDDGGLVQVQGVDYRLNTNTNLKQITLIQTVSFGSAVEWTIEREPSCLIEDIYRDWAEYVGYRCDSFFILHNQKRLPRTGFLEDHGVKNGRRMFDGLY